MNSQLKRKLQDLAVLPVVKLTDAGQAVKLAKALRKGGILGAEITFRTDQAPAAIRAIRQAFPDMILAAGTVLTVDQAEAAREAGADFLVSPGIDPVILDWAQAHDLPVVPGCMTPSDVTVAWEHGLDLVKIFPAETAGGTANLKALSGPFPQMQFMPSGGIRADNIQGYLALPQVLACGGSWMVPSELLEAGDYAGLQALASQAMRSILDMKLAHIGINARNEDQARQIAAFFETVFGFEARENPSSIFSDTYVETVKTPYLGTNGHIAISTPSVERAKAYLEHKGEAFNEESAVLRPDGTLQAIYLAQEVGGFAVHLVRRG